MPNTVTSVKRELVQTETALKAVEGLADLVGLKVDTTSPKDVTRVLGSLDKIRRKARSLRGDMRLIPLGRQLLEASKGKPMTVLEAVKAATPMLSNLDPRPTKPIIRPPQSASPAPTAPAAPIAPVAPQAPAAPTIQPTAQPAGNTAADADDAAVVAGAQLSVPQAQPSAPAVQPQQPVQTPYVPKIGPDLAVGTPENPTGAKPPTQPTPADQPQRPATEQHPFWTGLEYLTGYKRTKETSEDKADTYLGRRGQEIGAGAAKEIEKALDRGMAKAEQKFEAQKDDIEKRLDNKLDEILNRPELKAITDMVNKVSGTLGWLGDFKDNFLNMLFRPFKDPEGFWADVKGGNFMQLLPLLLIAGGGAMSLGGFATGKNGTGILGLLSMLAGGAVAGMGVGKQPPAKNKLETQTGDSGASTKSTTPAAAEAPKTDPTGQLSR